MNTSIVKWIMLLLVFGFMSSCTLEEPSLPRWLAEWNIPFDESFTMEEALEDSNFVADTTNLGQPIIAISYSDSTEPKTVSSADLSIKPDGEYASQNINDLTLGTMGPESSRSFGVFEILGRSLPIGFPLDMPDTTVQVDLLYLWYIDVGHAQIESGEFRFEFVNNTIFDIRSGMQITIYDDSTNTLLGTVDFPQAISAMDSGFASPDMDLSGETIHTRFLLQIQMPLAAISRTLTIDDLNGTAWVNGTLIDLKVYEAHAAFPPQQIFIQDSTSITDQDQRIRVAEIDEGKIDIIMENRLGIGARATVILHNFTNILTGETLVDSVYLEAYSPATPKTVYLEGYRIADYPDPFSGDLVDYIKYEINVETDSVETASPENYITITKNDSVAVTVTPDSLFFNKIDGQIDSIEIEIDPEEKTDLEDLSDIEGPIYLDSLQMILNFYNETNMNIDITLYISASNGVQDEELEPVKALIPKAVDGGYRQVKISGPDIVELMAILPTTIRLEAEAFVYGNGSVEVGQTVSADYQIYSPLYLRIEESSSITSDIAKEEMDEDTQKQIKDNVKSAAVFMDIINGLPVGSEASVYVGNDSTTLFDENTADDSTKFIIDLSISAGQIGSDGFVSTPAEDQINPIELNDKRLSLFYNNDIVYIGTKVTLNATDGLVKFRLNDEFSLQGVFRFQFMMNNED